ncbi:hypothetical protein G6M89_02410 [Natronolimnobius sp. AArcel1]|uniref:hypothetical protein n=1 Tax=Natronolimnobius sp. AArcel1 TaxID=1679093 RepID=UPI0013EBED83|nr:hypothetical protein [Natronolimnobius sp. AArcel1]NGM67873.1 hypothetical protein [Natronolimnobius sp. AArcel1]
MTDGDNSDDASALGTCPACGNPMAMTVVLGPGDAYANPCGCRIIPDSSRASDPSGVGSDLE